jgi:hypothetical protein
METELKVTSKVSAALLRSRMPSSACLIKLMNFLVKRPESESHNILPLLQCSFSLFHELFEMEFMIITNYSVSKANTEMHKQKRLPRELS